MASAFVVARIFLDSSERLTPPIVATSLISSSPSLDFKNSGISTSGKHFWFLSYAYKLKQLFQSQKADFFCFLMLH